ncbi:hypothetical protein Aargi30884_17280 [Amedibacterium intestinale]|uniref:Uncharacterized protein n=1 Tax=Amedibacterium intestinale TaxID=2583452 RepID=A0A6N4TK90_9FIRM|nr:hypothetical protein Aargi30884_17280 [Amedibacterium intestinale]
MQLYEVNPEYISYLKKYEPTKYYQQQTGKKKESIHRSLRF